MLRSLLPLSFLLLNGCPDKSAAPSAPASAGAPQVLAPASVWDSPSACETELRIGRRLARGEGVARIGSWNVRWFPDGKPGDEGAGAGTDVAWLACGIAWLGVDALAVQEIKQTARAQRAIAELTRRLNQHTGGDFALEVDACPNAQGQHVGILFDRKRVVFSHSKMLASLNPHRDACKDSLRPGLSGYLKFPGGLDLHLVALHSKSGTQRRSLDLRLESLRGIDAAVRELNAQVPDPDVVLAGDLNTMGCSRCSPRVSAHEELSTMDDLLARGAAPMRRVGADVACTELSGRGAALLDHFVVSRGLTELDPKARAQVSGICSASVCEKGRPSRPSEYTRRLSDHCPVLLDFRDRDLD